MSGQEFPVQYAILGSLIERESHGYELRRSLAASLGPIWRIATSRLYSALHRLEEEGFLSSRIDVQVDRPSRKVYAVTKRGEEAFWEWVSTPVGHVRDLRVELLAKLCFLHRLAPEKIVPLLDAETATLDRLRERLAQRRGLAIENKTLGRLALQFRLGQMKSIVDWLDKYREEL